MKKGREWMSMGFVFSNSCFPRQKHEARVLLSSLRYLYQRQNPSKPVIDSDMKGNENPVVIEPRGAA